MYLWSLKLVIGRLREAHTEERICSNTLQKGQTLNGHHADDRWMNVVTVVG